MKFKKNWKIQISETEKLSISDFSQFKNIKKVLLYFYPKDNTPGCTGQAVDFTALKKDFQKLGIMVLGVSPDPLESHKKFITDHKLKIALASDEEKVLARNLGAWGEKKNYGKVYTGIIRSTFLIDIESREIEKEWRNVRAKGHALRILKIIQSKK